MKAMIGFAMLMILAGVAILFTAKSAMQETEGVLLFCFGMLIGTVIGMVDKAVIELRAIRKLLQDEAALRDRTDASAEE